MCGICGIVQVGGVPREVVEPAVLDAMTDAMVHRGPDDRGTVMLPGLAFGARRLSIVDVEGGHQPFANEDGRVWGMQNGELYNHAQIRVELERDGHRFRSRCDTEILPHLYERHGAAFVERLRGKFGLAVWDARERRAVLARDRLGVKPLYWAQVGDLVVFASELKSLLASGLVPVALDYEAIDAYLTYGFVPAPRTPLAGVSKLLPGHRLLVDPGGVRLEQYWAYPLPAATPDSRPEPELAAELLERLREAVRLRLMSDVPLGAMLSGGLDSSLIVALMAEQTSEPVKTFSVGFREDANSNELADARLVANLFGCDHHELELSYTDDTVDLPQLVWHLDEPVADLSALGFLALSELARQHVTVALSGQGADELFGGYRKHRAAALLRPLGFVPPHFASRIARSAKPLGNSVARASAALAAPDPGARLLAMSGQLSGVDRALLLRGPLRELDGSAAARALDRLTVGINDADPLATTLYLDAQLSLPDDMLHYFDRTSMAHSLEVRVPFLDHELVEWAARIPSNLKVHRLTTKYLLKQAARPILPDTIIDKRKIGFFRQASSAWFAAQLERTVDDYLGSDDARVGDFLYRNEIVKLVRSQDRSRTQLLIAILILEVWLRTVVERAPTGRVTGQPGLHIA